MLIQVALAPKIFAIAPLLQFFFRDNRKLSGAWGISRLHLQNVSPGIFISLTCGHVIFCDLTIQNILYEIRLETVSGGCVLSTASGTCLIRISLGYSADRNPLGDGEIPLPFTLPKCRSSDSSGAGESAIESSQRVVLMELAEILNKKYIVLT